MADILFWSVWLVLVGFLVRETVVVLEDLRRDQDG